MATKLITRPRAPPAVVAVGLGLLVATFLLLATTGADASRPLKVSSSASSEGDGPQDTVVESPAPVGYIIQTVVVGAAEQHGGGAAAHSGLVNLTVDMLAGIKNTGPSPGDGH